MQSRLSQVCEFGVGGGLGDTPIVITMYVNITFIFKYPLCLGGQHFSPFFPRSFSSANHINSYGVRNLLQVLFNYLQQADYHTWYGEDVITAIREAISFRLLEHVAWDNASYATIRNIE